MSFVALIPARYGSTRLPGKPLLDVAGRPLVVRVCERAAASGARAVHVATDDARIAGAVRDHGFSAVMTRADHASGTDRIAEAVVALDLAGNDCVVNVQGDEPLIDPALIARVAAVLDECPDAVVSTACHPLHDARAMFNPNVVKVVLDARSYALYFSRAPIPYARDAFAQTRDAMPADLLCYRHIGLYGYRVSFLRRYAGLSSSPLEQIEALEQLRVLWHGEKIAVCVSVGEVPPGVDTIEDLAAVRRWFEDRQTDA